MKAEGKLRRGFFPWKSFKLGRSSPSRLSYYYEDNVEKISIFMMENILQQKRRTKRKRAPWLKTWRVFIEGENSCSVRRESLNLQQRVIFGRCKGKRKDLIDKQVLGYNARL